jgi:DnaJ-class molecular chaperone
MMMPGHDCRTRLTTQDGNLPSLDCPRCEGRGYVQRDDGEITICVRCEGTGVVVVDEDAGDALREARG